MPEWGRLIVRQSDQILQLQTQSFFMGQLRTPVPPPEAQRAVLAVESQASPFNQLQSTSLNTMRGWVQVQRCFHLILSSLTSPLYCSPLPLDEQYREEHPP